MTKFLDNPKHPIWSLIRLAIIMVPLSIMMFLNATNFDDTEIKTIGGMLLVACGAEGLQSYLQREKQ